MLIRFILYTRVLNKFVQLVIEARKRGDTLYEYHLHLFGALNRAQREILRTFFPGSTENGVCVVPVYLAISTHVSGRVVQVGP